MVYAILCDQYPDDKQLARYFRKTADRWLDAVNVLADGTGTADFNFTSFDLRTMKPVHNGRWNEPDASAGLAYLLFAAYNRFGDPEGVISYEGVIASLSDGGWEEVVARKGLELDGPAGVGDPSRRGGAATDFAVYDSVYSGILAAVVGATDVPGILQLDCRATDHFTHDKPPAYLLYNPHADAREVTVRIPDSLGVVSVYCQTTDTIVARGVRGACRVTMEPCGNRCLVVLPDTPVVERRGAAILSGGKPACHRPARDRPPAGYP